MGGFLIGGLEGIRTLDPYNANVVRSQLRYKPVRRNYIAVCVFCQAFPFCKSCAILWEIFTKGEYHDYYCRIVIPGAGTESRIY